MGLLSLFAPLEKAAPAKGDTPAREGLKSWTVDPYSFLESVTHRERPAALSFEQLRRMATQCDVVNAIITTRVNQVASFCEPQTDRHQIGFAIQMRDSNAPGSRAAAKMAQDLTVSVQHCGIPGLAGDNFEQFLRKFTRDSLIYDQAVAEVVPRRNGLPAYFEAVDAATIRIAASPMEPMDSRGHKELDPKKVGSAFQQALQSYQKDLMVKQGKIEVPAKYVQLINGTVKASYAPDELYFGIRNPRSDINVNGYGMSELENMIGIVTSYLYAEEYNRKIFTQGSIPKGILNVRGDMTDEQLAGFKREWQTLIAGVNNSWRTPVINAEDIDYVNLQSVNKDMEYMQWVQFLVRLCSALYLIDPAEINFDMPRGLEQSNPMIESSNESKLRASRDRGLQPLLRFVQRSINEMFVYRLDPDFEFRFMGLNARTAEQEAGLASSAVSTYKTLNEVRAENDLAPVPDGDIVLNPTYVGKLSQDQQMAMQQQQMELEAKMMAKQSTQPQKP